MLTRVCLENFKSQTSLDVAITDFTAFTGYNAAGKTTVLQSLVFLKQSLSRKEITFNDYLLRLGDFREVVYGHDDNLTISVEVHLDHDGTDLAYKVTYGKTGATETFSIGGTAVWEWDARSSYSMEPSGRLFLPQAAGGYGGGTVISDAYDAMTIMMQQKYVVEWFDSLLYLSSSRGFTKYAYPLMAGQPEPEEVARRAGDATLLEEWLANLIMYKMNEANRYPDMRPQLDVMRERLGRVGVDINTYIMNGPSVVIDLCEDGMWVAAVNSGYGLNQLVSFVALGSLLPVGSMIMIEEPEIHLHPKMQRIICDILVDIAQDGKQVVITTHSEHFLKTLAKRIEAGNLKPEDLVVYHFEKKDAKAQMDVVDVLDAARIEELF